MFRSSSGLEENDDENGAYKQQVMHFSLYQCMRTARIGSHSRLKGNDSLTRLPQGYCKSPTIFSQAMTASVGRCDPPGGSQILLHTDDTSIASPDEETCKVDTTALLRHLSAEGHKASKEVAVLQMRS